MTTWRKSTYSDGGVQGNCVELAPIGAGVGIRDSKNPDAGHLAVSYAGMRSLVERVKTGQVDLP